MAKPSMSYLVDRLLDGKLEQELRSRRAAGAAFDTIARWLATEHAIDVSSVTVRRWCLDLGIETEPEAVA